MAASGDLKTSCSSGRARPGARRRGSRELSPARDGFSVLAPPAFGSSVSRVADREVADQLWLLSLAYRRFNRRDLEEVIGLMCIDVDWANTLNGGREYGHDAVRAYWSRLFSVLIPRLEPVEYVVQRGRIGVRVRQVVLDARYRPLAHQRFWQVFRFRDGRIARMDVCGDWPGTWRENGGA